MRKLDFYEKARLLCDKAFAIVGLKKPANNVLHLGRTLGVNRAKEHGAPRDDVAQTSGHEGKDEAEKVF